jgi:hypothetical protein
MNMKLRLFPSLLALCLCSCGNPDATITWHKVGACNGGDSQSGDPTESYNAGPYASYVIFAIESVDNTGVNQAWTLDATKFHVGSVFFDPGLMIYSAKLGPFALDTFPVPANNKLSFSTNAYGALVVSTTAFDGASEADTANYSLLYMPAAGDPGVIMTQGPDASMAYTPNCADVQLK